MDNTVEQKIKEVLSELGCTECRSYPRDDAYIKAMQRIFALFDHYTTTKLNEVLDAVEDAIGRDEPSYTLDNPSWEVNRARNDLRAELRQKLSQIRKEKVNE